MIATHGVLRRSKSLWLSAWPLLTLVVFTCLVAVRLLPSGYVRAIVAAPILLVAPGSLTLGAVFSRRRRPQGTVFVCFAALLSTIWTAFASLTLWALGVLITADSTYWCLLTVSAVLAIVAEARLLLERSEGSHRTARESQIQDRDLSDNHVDKVGTSQALRGLGYAIVAVVGGVSLLAGGLYLYDHLPRPRPVGYTWIAWTGPPIKGDIAIGSAGIELHFRIVHHQTDTATFRLSAEWLSTPPQPLAKPLTLSIGPNKTFQGALFIPALPDGCTYRIVVSLTAAQQVNPFAKKPQAWSINADVHDPSKSVKTCT